MSQEPKENPTDIAEDIWEMEYEEDDYTEPGLSLEDLVPPVIKKKESAKDKKRTSISHKESQKTAKYAGKKIRASTAVSSKNDRAKKADRKKKKKKKQIEQGEIKIFDKPTKMFLTVCAIAVGTMFLLIVNILNPNILQRIAGSTPLDRNSTVMTIGSEKISADEYRYLVLSANDILNKNIEVNYAQKNPNVERLLLNNVNLSLLTQYAKIEWAKQEGIYLTVQDKRNLDMSILVLMDKTGGYEAFDQQLDKQFLTLDLFTKLTYNNEVIHRLESRLRAGVMGQMGEADIASYKKQNKIVRIKSIFLTDTGDEDGNDEQEILAEDILARLHKGEDFDTLMLEYGGTTGFELSVPDGYILPEKYYLGTEFREAANHLQIGEYSNVIETVAGFHILMRMDVTDQEARDGLFADRLQLEVNKYINALKVSYGRGFEKIAIANIKWRSRYMGIETTTGSEKTEIDSGYTTNDVLEGIVSFQYS